MDAGPRRHEREHSASLGAFLAALDAELKNGAAKATDREVAASLDEFARLLSAVETASFTIPAAARTEGLPVCPFWEAGLGSASGVPRRLVSSLEALGPSLSWTQNPNYRRRPPDPSFLDNYGYAVIAGPASGPPTLAAHAALALGVLLLGPHAHYPLHAHPAVEIYVTLTDGEWWRDEGPWRPVPPGATIHHAPNVRHATRAGSSPLLAIYLWRGDLATHAALTSRV